MALILELHSSEIFVELVVDGCLEVQRTETIVGYGALHLQKNSPTSGYKFSGATHLLGTMSE